MINRLELENFKCYTKACIELNNLTILSGANASGKSSIIQALLILSHALSNKQSNQLSTDDIYGINLGLPDNIISKNNTSDFVNIRAYDSNEDLCQLKLKLYDTEENPLAFKIENFSFLNNNTNLHRIAYINAERNGPRITNLINVKSPDYVGSHGENTNYVMSYWDRNLNRSSKEIPQSLQISKIKRFSAICEEWLNKIIPGTSIDVKSEAEYNLANLKIKNRNDFYVPTATGFGITYVLPIVVQGLIQSMTKDSHFIVENPEAHLHPYSQSLIGKFLAFLSQNGVQVTIETHSEHVINGCRVQMCETKDTNMKILFLKTNNNNTDIDEIEINEYGELTKWPKGFFDQSREDLKVILEKRLCKK